MCGRFTLRTSADLLIELFLLDDWPEQHPRYNIAPTQPVTAVLRAPKSERRAWGVFSWGLVPSWSKDPAGAASMINARAETAVQKPAFRGPFKHHRCLVPADGFYEWKRSGKVKQPYHIRRADGRPFAMAGLFEHWQGPDGSEIESCALLTTDANALMRPIHHRMPVILPQEHWEAWLDPERQHKKDLAELHALLRPADPAGFEAVAVSSYVGNARNQGPACLDPPADEPARPEQLGLFD